MDEKQSRQYQKLLQAMSDPENKSQFHNDPDVGHILNKLSVGDVRELRDIAMNAPDCKDGGCQLA